MSIRLIASDMDGTLLDGHAKISPGNAAALRAAHEAGIHLCINSGRTVSEIAPHIESLHLPFHIIGLNGGIVHSEGCADISFALSPDIVQTLVDEAQALGVRWLLYSAETFYSPFDWGLRDTPYHAIRPDEARDIAKDSTVLKLLIDDADTFATTLPHMRHLAGSLGQMVASSWKTNIEINAPDTNKGASLRILAERLGIAREEVMALGDYENDLTMLAWAGVSVAMENAYPPAVAAAKYRTGHHTQDGVAQAIYRYALGGDGA